MNESSRWAVLGVLCCGLPVIFLFVAVAGIPFLLGQDSPMIFTEHHSRYAIGGLLVIGVCLLIQLALSIYVAVDAGKRGMSGFLWGLFVFFTSIIGLIIYLIVTQAAQGGGPVMATSGAGAAGGPSPGATPSGLPAPTAVTPASCGECGAEVQSDFRVCPLCGHPVGARCPKCDRAVEPAWKICPHCTEPLTG